MKIARVTATPLNVPLHIKLVGADRKTSLSTCLVEVETDDGMIGHGLTGLIEFPAFQIPPGTRRGIVPDSASEAFARAMAEYAPIIEAELARLDRERQATTSRQLLAELRRALRGIRARLPQYELPKVESAGAAFAGTAPFEGTGAAPEGLPLRRAGARAPHTGRSVGS